MHLKTLEEEKNALLNYIEESVNVTQNASMLENNSINDGRKGQNDGSALEPHRMTLNDL